MKLLAAALSVALLPGLPAYAADAILVLGKLSSEGETPTSASRDVDLPRVQMNLGLASKGRTPVSVPANALVLPLTSRESATARNSGAAARIRLSAPAVGYLGIDEGKNVLRLAGKIAVETVDGHTLAEYDVSLTGDIPDGYNPGDDLDLYIEARAVGSAPRGLAPAFASRIVGRLEESQ